jgi:hypothetical protein
VISATLHGTTGGLALTNVDGSFYDFRADRYSGTTSEPLAVPPDDWGGKAICRWADRLAVGRRFDPEAQELVAVAEVLDRVYGR